MSKRVQFPPLPRTSTWPFSNWRSRRLELTAKSAIEEVERGGLGFFVFFCGKYRPHWGLSKPLGRSYVNTPRRVLACKVTQSKQGIRGKESKVSSAWVGASGQWVRLTVLILQMLPFNSPETCFQLHISHFHMRKVECFVGVVFCLFVFFQRSVESACVCMWHDFFAAALPPFSCTAVWEIPVAEAAEAAKAFNTRQTVI